MAFDCVLAAWTAHESELRGYLVSRLADRDSAEDLLQEVFLRAMAEGRRFCELSEPRAWLFRVARNALVDSTRRRRPSAELPANLPAPEADGPEPVDALAECLERTLADLAAPDQDVLRRCDLEHMPQARYAELHELGLPAVKARLRRARLRLRARLEQRCRVGFDETGRVCCHQPAEQPIRGSRR